MRYLLLLIIASAGLAYFYKQKEFQQEMAATVAATASKGIIGEEVKAGMVFTEVTHVIANEIPERGIVVAGVLSYIGNCGTGPLSAPAVQLHLFDNHGKQYAHKAHGGDYEPAVPINPGLRLEERWAFVLPIDAEIVRAEFTIKDNGKTTIDLTQRTRKNTAEIESNAHLNALNLLERMVQASAQQQAHTETSLADKRSALDADLKARAAAADEAWDKVDAQKAKTKELELRRDELRESIDKAKKKLDAAARQLEKTKEEYAKAKTGETQAKTRVDQLTKTLREYQEEHKRRQDRHETMLINDLNRARQELRRLSTAHDELQGELQTHTKTVTERQQAVTQLQAELKQLDADYARATQQLQELDSAAQKAEDKVEELEKKLGPAPVTPPVAPPETPVAPPVAPPPSPEN